VCLSWNPHWQRLYYSKCWCCQGRSSLHAWLATHLQLPPLHTPLVGVILPKAIPSVEVISIWFIYNEFIQALSIWFKTDAISKSTQSIYILSIQLHLAPFSTNLLCHIKNNKFHVIVDIFL